MDTGGGYDMGGEEDPDKNATNMEGGRSRTTDWVAKNTGNGISYNQLCYSIMDRWEDMPLCDKESEVGKFTLGPLLCRMAR